MLSINGATDSKKAARQSDRIETQTAAMASGGHVVRSAAEDNGHPLAEGVLHQLNGRSWRAMSSRMAPAADLEVGSVVRQVKNLNGQC